MESIVWEFIKTISEKIQFFYRTTVKKQITQVSSHEHLLEETSIRSHQYAFFTDLSSLFINISQ